MKTGVSVSERQGIIDWERVKEAKIDYAMICCGSGRDKKLQKDLYFQRNAEACMEYQIPFGTYFDSGAVDVEQSRKEAEFTLAILEQYSPEYPVMLHLEEQNIILDLSSEVIGDIVQAYCERVNQAGCLPGVYADKHCFSNMLTDRRFEHWFRWIVQHYKECTYAGTYHMWQYTSDARIPGIQGSVSLSESRMNVCDWREVKPEQGTENNEEILPDLHGYIGLSLAGALNSKGYPSDFAYRAALATVKKVVVRQSDYRGTAEQNLKLLRSLGGTVSSSKILREGTYIKLKEGSRNINTGMLFGEEVYENTYQAMSISGISVIFGVQGTVIGKVNRNSVLVV